MAAGLKARIVTEDERESDVRAHLKHLLGGALRGGKPARGAKSTPA